MTMSCWARRASSMLRRDTSTGSPTPLPGSGANTGTPARSPTTCSWFTAFGRCRSQATSSGVWPCPASHLASLPASVVLPEPCRPASMITVGGVLANSSRRVSPPRMMTSSSLTILMTCWAGFSACETSAPLARSLTPLMKLRTTGSATSASRRAMRISRAVASMSASDSRPLPRRFVRTEVSRSERVSNTGSRAPESMDVPGYLCEGNRPGQWSGAGRGAQLREESRPSPRRGTQGKRVQPGGWPISRETDQPPEHLSCASSPRGACPSSGTAASAGPCGAAAACPDPGPDRGGAGGG